MVMSPYAEVTAVEGDLLRQSGCDAIINSANEYLIAGGGVCGAIYRAAGPELEPYTRRLAPLALGESVISPGFKLSARWILHTRGPRYYEDPDPPRHLAQALTSAIRLADQNSVRRLAVPAISMGIYGYPAEEAVSILAETALTLAKSLNSLQEIRFVLIERELGQRFNDALALRR